MGFWTKRAQPLEGRTRTRSRKTRSSQTLDLEALQQTFALHEGDILKQIYRCSLAACLIEGNQAKLPKQGRLYLTTKHMCFMSMGKSVKIAIPIADVVSIVKAETKILITTSKFEVCVSSLCVS